MSSSLLFSKSILKRTLPSSRRFKSSGGDSLPFAAPPGPIPLGDKEQRAEMEELIKRGGLSDQELQLIEKGQGDLLVHKDAPKQPLQSFEGDVNPETGERGGPKGPDPTRYGDWERKGRVFDF